MMAAHGATYDEIVEIVLQANKTKSLSCRARMDALPQATSVYALVQAGKARKKAMENPNDPEAQQMVADLDIIKPDEEHSITPTLFERNRGQGSAVAHRKAERELLRKKKSGKEDRTAFLD